MNNYVIVNGCIIEDNTIYEVNARSPRMDNAPSYYRDPQYDSVKEKMLGVSNTFSFGADMQGLYNTGFHQNSYIFNNDRDIANDWTKREKKSVELFDFIMKPLKHLILNVEQAKEPMNYAFFENEDLFRDFFKVTLSSQTVFNTSNPKDKLALYISIVTGNICMYGKRSEEEKKLGMKDEDSYGDVSTQYVYSSIKNQKTKTEKNTEAEFDASYNFGFYLKQDKNLLINILNNLNLGLRNDVEDIRLKSVFKTQVLNNPDTINKFNKSIKDYEKDPKTFNKLADITAKVNSTASRKAIIKDGKTWYMGEIPLGSNKKSVVDKFYKDDALYQKFLNILDN